MRDAQRSSPDAATARAFVYVSNAEDGDISIYGMDVESGDLRAVGRAEAGKNVMPMAVSPDGRRLYAAIRSTPHRVACYAIDAATGQLQQLSTAPLPDSMAYVSVDRTGRFLFAASYGGDMLSVSPIAADGRVAEPVQVVRTGRHAHAVLPDPSNRFVYATNLGSDRILQLVFDGKTGRLSPNTPDSVAAPPGSGPRHFVFSPDGRFVFALGELAGTVTSYALDPATGLLSEGESVSAVPRDSDLVPGRIRPPVAAAGAAPADTSGWIWAADIQITPNGRFLYASERTHSTLTAFAVDGATGRLTYRGVVGTETQPRGFRIDPSGKFLVAAGEKSDRVSVYRIDETDGDLQLLARYPAGRGANWVIVAAMS